MTENIIAEKDPFKRAYEIQAAALAAVGGAKKTCSRCGRELGVEKFNKRAKSPDGLQSWCRECQTASNKSAKAQATPPGYGRAPSGGGAGMNPALAAFSPRELIDELRARGYEGELRYTYRITLKKP